MWPSLHPTVARPPFTLLECGCDDWYVREEIATPIPPHHRWSDPLSLFTYGYILKGLTAVSLQLNKHDKSLGSWEVCGQQFDGSHGREAVNSHWSKSGEKPTSLLEIKANLIIQVTWDGPDDIQNPRNWPLAKRWTTTLTVACFTLLSPLTSTMISPAINAIAIDLHDNNAVHLELTLSIFLLGLGFGPLILSPISEMYGRLPVLILGNLFFIVWNTASGFVQTTGQLMAFRLLAGLGASAPLAIGGGLLSDLWEPERRAHALAMYTSGPLLGPALGPIIGAYVTQHVSWRWVFWVISIASVGFQIIALLFLKESYPPRLLYNKAEMLREETGNQALHTQYEEPDRTLSNLLKLNLIRPVKLISTQIIIQILSFFMALLYGIMYLLLFNFPILWTDRYHESVGIGSLNYISTGLGFVVGSQGEQHSLLTLAH